MVLKLLFLELLPVAALFFMTSVLNGLVDLMLSPSFKQKQFQIINKMIVVIYHYATSDI